MSVSKAGCVGGGCKKLSRQEIMTDVYFMRTPPSSLPDWHPVRKIYGSASGPEDIRSGTSTEMHRKHADQPPFLRVPLVPRRDAKHSRRTAACMQVRCTTIHFPYGWVVSLPNTR